MNKPSLPTRSRARRLQGGVTAVEFALAAPLIFLLLLGAIEFGRLLYLWATVQEVTRNAARQAVVTNFNDSAALETIRRDAVFRVSSGALPGAPEVGSASVVIRYLNYAGNYVDPGSTSPGENIVTCVADAQNSACIRYVQVCVGTARTARTLCDAVDPVPFAPLFGLFSYLGDIRIPSSTVTMPAESLGYRPST